MRTFVTYILQIKVIFSHVSETQVQAIENLNGIAQSSIGVDP